MANRTLPTDTGPGLGGVLLAGIVANSVSKVEAEDREALFGLLKALEQGLQVNQPAVRHRYQDDLVGLAVSRQMLVSVDGRFEFEFDDSLALPVQLVLGALYAAQEMPAESRDAVIEAIKLAWIWDKPIDMAFIHTILNGEIDINFSLQDFEAWNDPVGWALEVLSLTTESDEMPSKKLVQKRFRDLLRENHPDHGAVKQGAAEKIKRLTDARDILVAKS